MHRSNSGVDRDLRAAIDDLNAEYAHVIDEDDLERWPAFFVDKCHYRIVSRADFQRDRPLSLWSCDSRAMLEDRVSSMRKVNVFEPHRYRHIIGRTLVRSVGEEGVRAITPFTVVRTNQDASMIVFAVGTYRDLLTADAAAPRLIERFVLLDSERIDTLMVIPL